MWRNEENLFCSPFLFLFSLFWCLSFIPQWVIGWFLSCWRKAFPAFQNHVNESSWWCACDGERKCVVEMWLCEKEKRKEKRKMFCQKIFSPKRSFGKTEECSPRKGRGEEPSSPHGKDCQNGDDRFVFWGHLLFTWWEWCLIKRERDSSSFVLIVIVSIVVNTPSDIPVVSHPIFLRTIFHNLFLNKKSFSFFRKNEIVVQWHISSQKQHRPRGVNKENNGQPFCSVFFPFLSTFCLLEQNPSFHHTHDSLTLFLVDLYFFLLYLLMFWWRKDAQKSDSSFDVFSSKSSTPEPRRWSIK